MECNTNNGASSCMREKRSAISHFLSPDIELKQRVGNQIYGALQGEIVEQIIKKSKISEQDTYWRSVMEGHSMKIDKEILGDLYELCHEVMDRLEFKEQVDFYITGDSSVNAFSLAASEEGNAHIVNINSALFNLMTRDELKFVIGHELGHLISRDTEFQTLVTFVFPTETTIPVLLQYKLRLYNQLAELVADRYGYLATMDLSVCVTAFFKLASGLDLNKMNVSIDSLIADNNKRLEYFIKDRGMSRATHPVNPIRVQALNLYASVKTQEALDEGMDELISILLKVGDNELDEWLALFIASAGLKVATLDCTLSESELDGIIDALSMLKIFPKEYLTEIANGDFEADFVRSVENIMKINPGMRDVMLKYMIDIVLSDKVISNEDLDFLYEFGSSIGYSDVEVATFMAEAIQQSYEPSIESIS